MQARQENESGQLSLAVLLVNVDSARKLPVSALVQQFCFPFLTDRYCFC